MEELTAVLAGLGLAQYADAFRAADVDLDVLPLLTDADLKEIGLSLGHRRKLLAAIADGGLQTPPPAEVATSDPVAAPAAQSGVTAPAAHSGEEQRRQVTVMFCDLIGSTDLTQRVQPEEMGRIIRQFQDGTAGAILRFEGFVDRFMGDSVLAFFGYPRAHEDAAERAVRAGLAIIELIGGLATPTGEALAVRIAIASGPAFFGEIVEHGGAREPIVTGEVVNLAARLQTIAPANGLVIAPATRRLLRDLFELNDLGSHDFKGIGHPVRVWQVGRERRSGTRFEAVFAQTRSAIVGREAETALLLDRWQSACSGEGQVVLLSGEAGMGKSRIAQVLRDHVAAGPHVTIRYQCSPFHRNSALYPTIEQLQYAARIEPGEPPEANLAQLEAVVGQAAGADRDAVRLLADLLSIPPTERFPALSLSPAEQKQRTMQVLVDQLFGLAQVQPVLLLVEDAHWIDPTTHELLTHCIMQMQHHPVLMLVTYRPEFRQEWANLTHVTTLALSGLARRQTMALVENIAGAKRLPPELVEQILSKTDGIPLFVEELAKAILELGILREGPDGYELVKPLTTLAIPETLHDSLLARIERHPSIKELAQIGAVIGREFAHAHLSALTTLQGEALDAAIRELLRAELVHERGPSRPTYVFKHALIQDAAYSTLVIARRQQLHAQCAAILQELSPEIGDLQPELLAHHYTEAGRHELAVEFWLKAGRRAAERSANVEAIAHLRHGVRLVEHIPDPERRAELELALQVELGVPLIATRGYAAQDTMAAWERARALAEQRGDHHQLLRTLYGLWAARCSLGETRVALGISERIIEIGRQIGHDGAEIVGHRVRGLTVHALGDQDAARAELEGALAAYDPQRHAGLGFQFGQDARIAATSILSTVLWLQGYPERARLTSIANVEAAQSLRHSNSLAYALAYGACIVALLRCDEAETMRLGEQLVTLATRHHLHLWRAYGEAYKGWALARIGDPAEGVAMLEEAMKGFARAGSGLYEPAATGLLAYALHRAGREAEAGARLDEAVAEAERREEMWCMPELLRLQARHAARRGELDRSRALREQALALARRFRLRAWELRIANDEADMLRRDGRTDEAIALLTAVTAAFPEPGDTRDWRQAASLLDGTRGVVTLRRRAGIAGGGAPG
jgi:predicted ATPase/class 3 adenylate cyclase